LHVKEIELKNFKSFGKRAIIPLKKDFIVVTGPNGSGKSNIVDALLFALCLSSSRAMRAERLPDLIYKSADGKNPDFAQATVRLDNTSRTMPIDMDEIEISRKIKVNGEKYHAAYYFNGKQVTQTELSDHLARAGITPEGYNVVMQGDVTRIIEMTPVERRRIIDEIAGVAEFEEKKRKAMDELDVVRERIGRVDVILEEVGSQLGRLKTERDRALSYRAHREERRRQEAFLLLARLKESESDLRGLEEESAALGAEREELAASLAQKRQSLLQAEMGLAAINTKISDTGEDQLLEAKRSGEEVKGEIARQEARIESLDRDLSGIEKSRSACYLEISRLQGELLTISENLRMTEIRLASVRGEKEDWAQKAESARQILAQADCQHAGRRDRLAALLQEKEAAKSSKADLIREQDRLLDTLRRMSLEREELGRATEEASESIATAEQESAQLEADLEGLGRSMLEVEKERSDLESSRLRLKREVSETERSMQRLQTEYARVEAQMRAVEERAGYSKAVEAARSAMQRDILKGLHGTIADLGEVDPQYSAALEIAAGARMQSLVAESDEDASMAIDYLKRSQIGRATFLPLNKMERGSLPSLPSRPGVVEYALNLVKFDKKFYPAFWYVFRDTLVVESLAVARQLMGRYRMVTLDGELVERSGAMTGGHYKSRLKFAADENQRLLEITERISSSDHLRGELLDRMDGIEGRLSALKRQSEDISREMASKTVRREECQAVRPRLERALAEKRERLEEMEKAAADMRGRLDAQEEEIDALQAQISRLSDEQAGLEREMAGSRIPELTAEAESDEAEARRQESRAAQIEAELVRERLREEGTAARLDEASARRDGLEAQRLEATELRRAAVSRIGELRGSLLEIGEKERALEKELKGLKGEKGELVERMLALEREIDQVERDLDRLEARSAAASGAASETRSQVEQLRQEISAAGVSLDEEPPRSETVAHKIRALEQAMQDLEPINMLAIEEYDRVDTRFRVLDERRSTLNRERDTIIEKLERYDLMKKEAFLASFESINGNFQQIFRDLSGGDGELILESREDPLSGGMTIKARPAGKVFHRLEAMSGGEKSLTALSFIFAIQRHRPAPFYAMDEIDMFLDGSNADKVARLIHRISEQAQFIVVSLRRPMIMQARYTVGVAMQEKNISSITGIYRDPRSSRDETARAGQEICQVTP